MLGQWKMPLANKLSNVTSRLISSIAGIHNIKKLRGFDFDLSR